MPMKPLRARMRRTSDAARAFRRAGSVIMRRQNGTGHGHGHDSGWAAWPPRRPDQGWRAQMRYAAFERLVLVLGGASVLATLALASRTPLLVQEVIAQLLVFGVLVGAVHWGRRGGFAAAIIASVACIVAIWIPELGPGEMTTQILVLMLLRVLAYGLIGIVGGALCAQDEVRACQSGAVVGRRRRQRHLLRADARAPPRRRHRALRALPGALLRRRLRADDRTPSASPRRTARRATRARRRRVTSEATSGSWTRQHAPADGRFVVLLPHTPKEGGRSSRSAWQRVSTGQSASTATASPSRCAASAQAEDTDSIARLRAGLQVPSEDQALSPA